MKRPVSLLLLVLCLVLSSEARLPFYCRIRRVDCTQQNINSKCCPPTTTTEATSEEKGAEIEVIKEEEATDSEEGDREDEETVQQAQEQNIEIEKPTLVESELLEAQPSQIDEVIAKTTGEIIQPNNIPSPASKPEKVAPKFCLVLKFNCKARSSHPCCRYPLPPRVEAVESSTTSTRTETLKVRPMMNTKLTTTQRSIASNIKRKTTFNRRPLIKKPVKFIEASQPQEKDSKIKFNDDTEVAEKENKTSFVSKRRNSLIRLAASRPRIKKPELSKKKESGYKVPIRKTNLIKRRVTFNGNKNSAVCRIINCKRNPLHKCCKEAEDAKTSTNPTTTTESKVETVDMIASTTTLPDEIVTEQEGKELLEERAEVSQIASVSSVETRLVQATSPRRIIKENSLGLEPVDDAMQLTRTTMHPFPEEMVGGSSQHPETHIMQLEIQHPGDYLNVNRPDMFETTMSPPNLVLTEGSVLAAKLSSTDQSLGQPDVSRSQKQEEPSNQEEGEEEIGKNVEKSVKVFETESQYMTQDFTLPFQTDEVKDNTEIETHEFAEDISIEKMSEDTFVKTAEFTDDTKMKTANEIDGSEMEPAMLYQDTDFEPTELTGDTNILDPNQIAPRVSGRCFRFDCSSNPYHACCPEVKSNQKRHLRGGGEGEERGHVNRRTSLLSLPQFRGLVEEFGEHRVTATVTRVEKSINQW